jgi:acyl carrier protein
MISERLQKTILKELKLEEFPITANTTAVQIPGWDSLNHINVILAVEKEYGIRFKNIEVLRLRNIGELQSLIDSKIQAL